MSTPSPFPSQFSILDDTISFFVSDPSLRAVNPLNHKCQYRTPDGKKCAVGRYITDSCYNLEMDKLMQIASVLVDAKLPHPSSFWAELQCWHDNDMLYLDSSIYKIVDILETINDGSIPDEPISFFIGTFDPNPSIPQLITE